MNGKNTRIFYLLVWTLLTGSLVAWAESGDEQPDLEGRTARMTEIESALDTQDYVEAERLMHRFREVYPASSGVRSWPNGNEVVYLYDVTYRVASHYLLRGQLEKALAVYEDELRSLSPQIPHYSYYFVGLRVPLLLELNPSTTGELRGELKRYRAEFERRASEVEHPGRKNLYEGLASRMASATRHLDLIGKKAPDFRFTRAYNAKLPLTLESLRGKVVLIDFWATWCAPCMAAWPDLRRLYQEKGHRGLEILGVTSLQGSFGGEKGISPEREIELTEQFIDEHQVSWPILFSDRPVNDPEYAATTLPSYAVIDRQGRIVRILVGDFEGLGERIIDRLLDSEDG